MTLPVCTEPGCFATGPHTHRVLVGDPFHPVPGDVTYAPQVREPAATSPSVPAGPTRVQLRVLTIPLVCVCGHRWQGPAFTPLRPGEVERPRTCEACLTRAEAACLARTPPAPAPATLKAPRVIGQRELPRDAA